MQLTKIFVFNVDKYRAVLYGMASYTSLLSGLVFYYRNVPDLF